jgi:peptide/nickel transport system ATP-binding protein
LLEAVPRVRLGRERRRRGAQAISSQSVGPTGCAYVGRCSFADAHCRAVAPMARSVGPGHTSACHHAETIMALPPLVVDV